MTKKYKTILNLIGEQPLPNYIPVKWCKDKYCLRKVISLYTKRTEKVSNRLKDVLEKDLGLNVMEREVDPYDIEKLIKEIKEIAQSESQIIFNLTGGTKPMTFAGFYLSIKKKIPYLYLQSEGDKMVLRIYEMHGEPVEQTEIIQEDFYNLETYLKLHLNGKFKTSVKRRHGGYFKDNNIGEYIEKQIFCALKSGGIETLKGVNIPPNIEIDAMVKYKHYVGVIEIKKTLKSYAVNQVVLLTIQPGLGTYIRRILVSGPPRDWNDCKDTFGRAEISYTQVIILKSLASGQLSEEDKKILVSEVKKWLENPSVENRKRMKEKCKEMLNRKER